MLHAVNESSVIDVSIGPKEKPIGVFGFIIDKVADVEVSGCVFQSVAVLAVVLKVSLVKSQLIAFVKKQPVAVIELVADLTEIDSGN